MINIKDFNPNLSKVDKKPYKNIGIHNIGHITIKNTDDYKNINSLNTSYLIIGDVNGFFEEKNGNKYLIIDSTAKNKGVLKKCIEL